MIDHMHWVSTHMKLMSYKNLTIRSYLHQMDEIMLAIEFQISPFQLPWIKLDWIESYEWKCLNDENQTYIIEIGKYGQNHNYRWNSPYVCVNEK
jgi:hypothetical protein